MARFEQEVYLVFEAATMSHSVRAGLPTTEIHRRAPLASIGSNLAISMRYEVAVFFSIARREIRYIQARQDPTSLRFPGLRISQAFEEQRPGKIGVGCPALARASFGQFR
jgi:hypothetical protein